MKILLVSDKESPYYWDYYQPGRLDGIDLIISCGDLKANYLSFLVTMGRARVLYVHGNHDRTYEMRPPEGCDCIEDKLVTVNGLRILGLGGSIQYSGGPHQYTERQMARRIRKLRFQLWRAGGVDLVVTHSPARGYGDGEDYAHRGFECLLSLLDRYKPMYMVHGHVHMCYGADLPRVHQRGETTIINAYERYILDIPDGLLGRRDRK
ncbi:MAG: metallophosphoesterase [Oscillospiraceae bacterium]|nr:metallophosphoesterase [Oscillospiraceae bacterium]